MTEGLKGGFGMLGVWWKGVFDLVALDSILRNTVGRWRDQLFSCHNSSLRVKTVL